MSVLRQRMLELQKQVQTLQMSVHEECYRLQQAGVAPGPSELCDVGYLCREMSDSLDECRKELNAHERRIGHVLALTAVKAKLADPTLELRVDGELALGLPEVKERPRLPKPETPEYERLMTWLGVSPEVTATGLLSASFSRLTDHLQALSDAGKPVPSDLVGTFSEYRTIFRGKKQKKS